MQQATLFVPETRWSPPSEFPSFEDARLIAVDLETCDPRLRERGPGWAFSGPGFGHIAGIAVAVDDWSGYYPIGHEPGGNLDREVVFRWLRTELGRPHPPKVFANASYDVGWLARAGIIVEGPLWDVQVAAPLLDERRRSYSLDNLARDCLGERKDEKLLREAARSFGFDPKGDLWRLPATFVGAYAEHDAALTLRLWEWQRPRLEAEGLWSVFETETDLVSMIVAMRMRGVRVDVAAAERLATEWRLKEQIFRTELRRLCGTDVEVWEPASCARALATEGIAAPTHTSGDPSVTQQWLETLGNRSKVAQVLLRARRLNRARGPYLERMILEHHHRGRIHAQFNALRSDDGGTVTGRFSCSQPNLQQVPARDPEIGPAIRGLFLPEEGTHWLSADYSQQEPRLMVHYATLLGLDGAAAAAEQYRTDPNTDFHAMVAELAGIPRKQAKVINLGLAYGMGKQKLAASLGLNVEAAQPVLRQYHERVPWLRSLSQVCESRATSVGFLRTLLGRRVRFDLWEPVIRGVVCTPAPRLEALAQWPGQALRRAYTYKALNALIQASAADQTKAAMRACWAEKLVPLLTLHDELAFSVDDVPAARRIARRLETAVDLKVPSRVDAEMGPTWGDCKDISVHARECKT